MAFPIPAICQNPFCGLVYFVTWLVDLTHPDSVVTIHGATVGPCPRCGGRASIVDGTYRLLSVGTGLIKAADVAVLERAVAFLQRQQAGNQPIELLKQEAKAEVPELQTLWDLMPKKRTEAYTLMSLLVTVILFVLTQMRSPQKEAAKSVVIPSEIVNALSQIQRVSQPDTHTARSARKKRSKERH
jgi:hypothetical protein